MKTAKFIRQLEGKGDARLYQLTPPLKGHEYVIVSALDVQFDPVTEHFMQTMDSLFGEHLPRPLAGGLETLIFASNENGETLDCSTLDGIRGELNHGKALLEAGYLIMKARNGNQ